MAWTPNYENRRILIVDDDMELLNLLEKNLSAAGYEVFKAATGREAFLKAKIHFPNLILLDIVLPDIDGSEVVKLVTEEPHLRHVPIIFLSGILSPEESKENPYVKVGGTNYPAIAKPFTFDALMTEIQRILK